MPQTIEKIHQLLQQGQLKTAEKALLELIESEENADALHLYGILLATQKHYEKALEYFLLAKNLTPDNPRLINNIANVYKHLGAFDKAISTYKNALKYWPESDEVYNNLAILFHQQGKTELALEHYLIAINLNSNSIEAYFNLALLYIKLNQIDDAIKNLKIVIHLQHDHIKALNTLADVNFNENNFKDAKKYYMKVLEIKPTNIDALNNLGATYLKLDDPQTAIDKFQQVLMIDENNIHARNNLAATYLHENRFDNAAKHYKYLINLTPNDTEAYYNLGVAEMALGKLPEAKTHFEKVIAVNKQHVDAYCNLAAILMKLGKRKMALKQYKQAQLIQPNNALVNYMIAALEHHAGFTQAPSDYVKNLFDHYSGYYDKHVDEILKYQVPELMREEVIKLKTEHKGQWDILDLGCGTGLSGKIFTDTAKYIHGIDISPKMLEIASIQQIYDKLTVGDITQQLASIQQNFDLIIAADVFVYIGDLESIFQHVAQHLKPKGLFSFTCEAYQNHKDYDLLETARFAHNKKYIEKLAKQFKFDILLCKAIVPRYQDKKPIDGYLFILSHHATSNSGASAT